MVRAKSCASCGFVGLDIDMSLLPETAHVSFARVCRPCRAPQHAAVGDVTCERCAKVVCVRCVSPACQQCMRKFCEACTRLRPPVTMRDNIPDNVQERVVALHDLPTIVDVHRQLMAYCPICTHATTSATAAEQAASAQHKRERIARLVHAPLDVILQLQTVAMVGPTTPTAAASAPTSFSSTLSQSYNLSRSSHTTRSAHEQYLIAQANREQQIRSEQKRQRKQQRRKNRSSREDTYESSDDSSTSSADSTSDSDSD